MTVALRREEERALETRRHETLFAEEREALEAAHEALAERASQHEAKLGEFQQALEASRERAAELRRHNEDKSEALEKMRVELDAMRRARDASRPKADDAASKAPSTPEAAPAAAARVQDHQERRAKMAQDSARRRARLNERRELAAKLEGKLLANAPSPTSNS